MQPLNTSASWCASSTMGWAAASERSITLSLRWARATHPPDQVPSPSGPRGASLSTIRSTVGRSAPRPSYRISPAMPHMVPPRPRTAVAGGGQRYPRRVRAHLGGRRRRPYAVGYCRVRWVPLSEPEHLARGTGSCIMVVERVAAPVTSARPRAVPTFGVEEEYLLLHPATGIPVPMAAIVLDDARSRAHAGTADLQPELVRCQLELAT